MCGFRLVSLRGAWCLFIRGVVMHFIKEFFAASSCSRHLRGHQQLHNSHSVAAVRLLALCASASRSGPCNIVWWVCLLAVAAAAAAAGSHAAAAGATAAASLNQTAAY